MINAKIDETDIAILIELQKNGNIKNVDLAEKISLSPSPCLQRVKRLEKLNLIEGYGAKIAINKIADTIQVLTQFTIKNDNLEAHHKFQKFIVTFPQVMDCFMGSGGFDYQVRFICKSIEHYQDIIQIILDAGLEISKYHSYVVMKEVISRKEYPVSSLLDKSEGNRQ